MNEEKMADFNLSESDFATMLGAAMKGATVSDIANMNTETIEGLYTLAYNLYTSGNYADAETVFRALCVYKHTEYRFWMGLGGSCQALGKFKEAIDAYSMAGVSTALKNPEPFMFAALAYLKMGDKENAIASLKGLLTMGDDSPAHVACREKAGELLKLLEAKQN